MGVTNPGLGKGAGSAWALDPAWESVIAAESRSSAGPGLRTLRKNQGTNGARRPPRSGVGSDRDMPPRGTSKAEITGSIRECRPDPFPTPFWNRMPPDGAGHSRMEISDVDV